MKFKLKILVTLAFIVEAFKQQFAFALKNENESSEESILLRKSQEMRSYMNYSKNPCTNFYNFACGNWDTLYPVSRVSGRHFSNYYTQLHEAYNERVTATLKGNWQNTRNRYLRKLRTFFQSCTSPEQSKATKLLKIISKFGEMPVVIGSTWNAEKFDWIRTLASIKREYGFEILIGLTISSDLKSNQNSSLYIENGHFDLETKSMYQNKKHEQFRKAQLYKIALDLQKGLRIDNITALAAAADIFKFEQELALGLLDANNDLNLDEIYQKTNIDELQQKYAPIIDFVRLVNITFGEIPHDNIYEGWPQYLSNLADTISRTKKSVVANYIFYQLIKNFLIETKEHAETNCLHKVKQIFSHEIDTLVYNDFRNDDMENDVKQLWESLITQFKRKLHHSRKLNWLTRATRQAAIKKLEVLKLKINVLNETELYRALYDVKFTEHSFINNLAAVYKQRTKNYYKMLHSTPHFEGGSDFSPAISLTGNIVTVPVTFLQPSFVWESYYPAALKYAVTGFLLAHEIIHAFDNTGRRYCVLGNMKNWWDKLSESNFFKLRSCFTTQYHSYVYGGENLPKSDNQDENIADNGGVQVAFKAYMKFLKSAENKLDSLPSFEIEGAKLFFLAFAQFFCGTEMDYLKSQNAENEHTPNEFRVLGTLSNFKAFSKAYNCPVGSTMNPAYKCLMY